MLKYYISLIIIIKSISGLTQPINLTLDNAVHIALDNSYQIRYLEMDIERTRLRLQSRQSGLKSRVYMNLQTPDLRRISESKWNSTLYRDEIVKQNIEKWQSELSIKQPVVFFGYPTNGYLSLNYRLYRYQQKDNGNRQVDYYNRLYLKYEQPFFTPNELKNDLERARLDLKNNQYEYLDDRVDLIRDIGEDYYELFQLACENELYKRQISIIQKMQSIAQQHVKQDPDKDMESLQADLELTNEKETLLEKKSELRRKMADMKQSLRIDPLDSVYIEPNLHITPISIQLDQAIEMGVENSPHLKQLKIYKRNSELDVQDEKGHNSFNVNLELTYGLEKEQNQFNQIWEEYDNSNSATLNAYIPLWDWGERKKAIQAELVDVRKRNLEIDEEIQEIKTDIVNTYNNLTDYQARTINLEKSLNTSLKLVEKSLSMYEQNKIAIQEMMQIVRRHKEIENKFIEVYIGFKESLLKLNVYTLYDFEKSQPLIDIEFNNNN